MKGRFPRSAVWKDEKEKLSPENKTSRYWSRAERECFTATFFFLECGRGKESLQRSLINFHLYFTQTKGNTIGWKMTFRKSKLIDNRPSWHPLRLCVKFGSQGDQIGTENLFQPSMQTGSFVVILAKRILRAEDKSDRVCSSCGRKMKTLHQLYSFVSSALFSSENRESESEEWLKRCLPTSVSSPDWILLGRKIQKHVLDSVAV